MASLVLRGNTWHVVWRFRGRQHSRSTECAHDGKEANGKPRPTAAAKRELRKLESELDRGKNPQNATLDELLSLVEKEYEVSGLKSIKSLRSRLPHIREFFGTTQARTVTQADLIEYGEHRKRKEAGPATINRELEVIGKALHLGYGSGKVDTWIRIKKLKEPPPRQGFFDEAKINAIIRHLPDYLRAPVMFAWLTGWRRSEVFGLQWKDVDFSSGEVRLWDSKNGTGRVFKMTEAVRNLLENAKVLAVSAEQSVRTFNMPANPVTATTPSPFVFVHRRTERYGGNALPIADFRKAWDTACVNAGYPGMVFHDLRRSAARRLEMEGNSRSVIMEVMGHKSESMFHRYRIVGPDDANLVTSENEANTVGKLLALPKARRGKRLKMA